MKKNYVLIIIASLLFAACNNANKSQRNISPASGETEKASAKELYLASDNSSSLSYKADYSQDQCRDILSQGVMREYKLTNRKEYSLALRKAISMSDEQIRKSSSSQDMSVKIGIKLLTLGFGSSSTDEEYLNIKKKYTDNSTLDISDKDLEEIEARLADPVIVQAWIDCMAGTKKGIVYKIVGDVSKEFTVQIHYVPTSGYDPRILKINNFTFSSGIEMNKPIIFKPGIGIPQYQSISQKFTRKSNEAASVVIDSRYQPINIEIGKIEVDKPKEDSVEIWAKVDESGTPYKQVFYSQSPECKDCSDKPLIFWSKIETLDNKNGRIYRVDRDCSGGGCGWNYSGAPDGYSIVYHILKGENQFWFERRSGGASCTEINIAYYELKRLVPKKQSR